MPIQIKPIPLTDRVWVTQFLENEAGDTHMVSRGILHHCDELPGFIGVLGGEPVGLLTYRIDGRTCEVVTLHTAVQNQGVGSALLEQAIQEAQKQGCARIWLITTNDNKPAINFYRNRGWQLTAVYKNALDKSRQLKPEIPRFGLNGVPIQDELEFERKIIRDEVGD
ncbi:MAG: GNAT family N-acetyltransferase [Chloroflexi bacterium]|nr:GNAT family N-acetyltransferase [Chloroflexota bacterium]